MSEFDTAKVRRINRYPHIYNAYDVLREDLFGADVTRIGDAVVYQRPHKKDSLRNRFRRTWMIWTGRADLLHWPEQETFETYPDHGD